MNNQQFIILVGAVVFYRGKILITQRSLKNKFLPGIWGIPAGKIDFSESSEKALIRELQEETGLVIENTQIIGSSTFLSEYKNKETHNLQVNYVVNVKNDIVELDSSSMDYKWLSYSEIITSSLLDKFTISVIKQAEKFIKI